MGVHYAHIVMYIQYITHMHIHGINSNICEHHGISWDDFNGISGVFIAKFVWKYRLNTPSIINGEIVGVPRI